MLQKSNGTVSIMMAGNSYVTNLEGHIRAQFNGNYSDWRTLYIDGNTIIFQQFVNFGQCLVFQAATVSFTIRIY